MSQAKEHLDKFLQSKAWSLRSRTEKEISREMLKNSGPKACRGSDLYLAVWPSGELGPPSILSRTDCAGVCRFRQPSVVVLQHLSHTRPSLRSITLVS